MFSIWIINQHSPRTTSLYIQTKLTVRPLEETGSKQSDEVALRSKRKTSLCFVWNCRVEPGDDAKVQEIER